MAHHLFNVANDNDPITSGRLRQAYDEVWQDIAGYYQNAATIEDRSIRLALIILELANTGARDLEEIKSDALAIMLLGELESHNQRIIGCLRHSRTTRCGSCSRTTRR